jgi:hypothetical protein
LRPRFVGPLKLDIFISFNIKVEPNLAFAANGHRTVALQGRDLAGIPLFPSTAGNLALFHFKNANGILFREKLVTPKN